MTTEVKQWQDFEGPVYTTFSEFGSMGRRLRVKNSLRSQTTVICSMHARAVGGGSESNMVPV